MPRSVNMNVESVMPTQTSAKPAQNSTSRLEISTLQKDLASHQSEVSQKLAATLEAKISQTLNRVVSGVDKSTVSRLAAEIAAESSRDILENIAKINNFNEANTVIADSLTQSIVAHPELDGKLKINEGKIFAGLLKQTQDVAQAHQNDLAKAAVLGSIVNIARLEKPDEQLRTLVVGAVDQAVATRMPLAKPDVNQTLYGNTSGFLQTYLGNLNARIQPQLSQGKIPDFASYQTAKSAAFSEASGEFAKNVRFKGRIDPTDITNRIGFILGLDPQSTQFASVGQAKGVNAFMMRMMLASNKGQEQFDNALISHDRGWLEKQLSGARSQVEKLKKQRSLTYKDRKAYLLAQKNLQALGRAFTFRAKNEQRAKNWMALVQSIPAPAGGHNLTLAYQAAITSREAAMGNFPGVYAPRSLSGNPIFMARNTLSLLSPKLGLGDLFGSLRESFMSPTLGMGKTITTKSLGLGIASAAGNLMNRIWKGAAVLVGGMLLFFYMMFGKAALMGALIGAGVGGVVGMGVGGFLGFQIGVALAPFTFGLSIPIFTGLGILGGGFVGAFVGGVAGGLIALGLTSGSTTAVSMGGGAAIGGVIGTYAGAVVGASIGTAIGTGLAVITGGLATPLIPVFTAMGAFTGAAIGAVVGTFVGAAIGYLVGKYVIGTIGAPASGALAGAAIGFYFGGPPGALIGAGIGWLLAGGWSQVKDFLTGAGNVGAGAATGLAGFVTGLASTIWGGLTAGVGIAFSGLSGAMGFLVGGLGSLSIPTFVIAVPVFGGIGAITIGSLIVGITTATSFFSTDKEIGGPTNADNAYFKIEKSANPTTLILPDTNITFTITLTVKDTNLSEIVITDDNITVDGLNKHYDIKQNDQGHQPLLIDCNPAPPTSLTAHATWSCSFKINSINNDYTDTLVVNTVTVTAKPEGQPDTITGSDSASVKIGNPPVCETHPCGWPTTGTISQGTHVPPYHNETIDITNALGTPLYATINNGKVTVSVNDCSEAEYDNHECDSNELAGNFINIVKDDFRILYAHMQSFSVSQNQTVSCGQVVGTMGYSGLTDPDDKPSGSHLHYDFKSGGAMAPPNIPAEPTVGLSINDLQSCIP